MGRTPRLWTTEEDAALAEHLRRRPGSIPQLAQDLVAAGWGRTAASIESRAKVLVARGVVVPGPVAPRRMGGYCDPTPPAAGAVEAHRQLVDRVIARVFSHGAAV